MIYKEELVLRIGNTILRASLDALIKNAKPIHLTSDVAAAATTIVVDNWKHLVDNDYLLILRNGVEISEITQLTATPTTTSVAVDALAFDHFSDTEIFVIPYNRIVFYNWASDVDANSVDITSGILGSLTDILPSKREMIYKDATNSTGYGYFRFENEETGVYSEYSAGVNYEGGNAYNSLEKLAKEGTEASGVELGDTNAKEDQILRDANEAQDIILKTADWAFEITEDLTSITSTENENKYALSGLTTAMKYPDTKQGILNVRFGSKILDDTTIDIMDEKFENIHRTTLSATAAVAATSITLTDSYEFSESGTVYIGSNSPAYTVNTETTGVLSGISASDITVEVASGATVWQGITPGVPREYAIFNGNIILNVPVETNEVGKKIKFRYLKAMTRFTSLSDTTSIPFQNAIAKYIAFKIESRKKNVAIANIRKSEFYEIIALNKKIYQIQTLEITNYYDFESNVGNNRVRIDN